MCCAVNFVIYLVGISGKISYSSVPFIMNMGLILEAMRTVLLFLYKCHASRFAITFGINPEACNDTSQNIS
jgi:hypothetical protein